MNYLYLGDCLNVLRNELEFKPESVDLIYIDPPFNSKRNYNVFFDDKELQTQRIAFEDTWSLKSVGDSLAELDTIRHDKLLNLLNAYRDIAPQVFPYVVMMALRIIELHKVLKPTGSFYLHCDPTASHYLKTVCDAIFGVKNFRNEIIWQRTSAHNDAKRYGKNNDIILFYSKSEKYLFNTVYMKYTNYQIQSLFTRKDKKGVYASADLTGAGISTGESGSEWSGFNPTARGRHWATPTWLIEKLIGKRKANKLGVIEKLNLLHEKGYIEFSENGTPRFKRYLSDMKGCPAQQVWIDIPAISSQSKERLGYPTQKPRALLERIIKASSNEGDVVLDAFCGCGTSIDAAESLKRQWIGIDIAPFAVSLIKRRLEHSYGDNLSKFEVRGTPKDEASAIKLWEQNAFAFEDWWLTELGVFATTYGKKGADRGVDGVGKYKIPKVDKPIKVCFQVKGGKVQSKDIDALMGVVALDKYDMGVLLTRYEPSKPMILKATQAGQFEAAYGYKYPKIQIMTLADYFVGKPLNLPKNNITFKNAVAIDKEGTQNGLL